MKKIISLVFFLVFLGFFMINLTAAATWTAGLSEKMIAYYNFDEPSGNTTDIYTWVHNSTANTGATYGEVGKNNKSYGFAGAQVVKFDTSPSDFDMNNGTNFTISFWINTTNTGVEYYVANGKDDSSSQYLIGKRASASGDYLEMIYDGQEPISDLAVPLNAWTHIAVVKRDTNLTFYVNGIAWSVAATSTIATPAGSYFKVGGYGGAAQGLSGFFDELAVWNRSLTGAEIATLYDSGTGTFYSVATPAVTLVSPADSYNSMGNSVVFNCSAQSTATTLNNVSLIIDGVRNYTLTGSASFLSLQKNVTMAYGGHTWSCNATDDSNSVFSSSSRSLILGAIENNQTYNPSAVESTSQTFSINITYASDVVTNIQGILIYNNTRYSGTKSGTGDNVIFTRSVVTPSVDSPTLVPFYWEIILGSDIKVNSTQKNQTVGIIAMDDCTVNSIVVYNFSIADERTLTSFVGASQNTTGKVDIQMYTSDRQTLVLNFSKLYSKINPFKVCLNNSLSTGEKYNIDAQVLYYADDYVKEYYHIQNGTIDSSHFYQNITLYSLGNTTATTFKIIYKDENFLPVENALVQIQRKYIDEGIFRTIEIPKTDSNGETIAHLEQEDVVYTFIILKNGKVLATFNNFLVKCEDPVLGKCNINLNAFKGYLEPDDFVNLNDFSFNIEFNRTSRIVQSTFTIPSGSTASILLNVTKFDAFGNDTVCTDSLTSASGTLLCTVPAGYGNTTLVVEIYKDGKIVGRSIFGMDQDPRDIYGGNLAFIGFIMILTLAGIGMMSSPIVSGLFLIIGGVVLVAFNIFTNSGIVGYGATALWLIIAIVVIIIKAARRE